MSTTFCAHSAVDPPRVGPRAFHVLQRAVVSEAAIAQLGERETEDLKVPSSILGLGNCGNASFFLQCHRFGRLLFVASMWHAGWQRTSKRQRTHMSLHLARIELATFSVLG